MQINVYLGRLLFCINFLIATRVYESLGLRKVRYIFLDYHTYNDIEDCHIKDLQYMTMPRLLR